MKKTLLRAGALSCALLASTALVSPAQAQSLPRFNQVDGNGVDLVTGDYFFSMTEGSIGSGEGALALARNWAGEAGWTDNWTGTVYTSGSVMVVEFGTYADTFTYAGYPTVFTNTKGNGATLEMTFTGSGGGGYRYTAADGTQIDFVGLTDGYSAPIDRPCRSTGGCALPVSIRRPDGMTQTLHWDIEHRIDQNGWTAYARFRGVSNSANYSFTVNYATNTPGSGPPVSNWYVRTGAQFTNLDSAPASLPTVSYATPSSGVTEVTDTGGQVWRLTESGGLLTGIRRPGAGSDTTAISYSSGQVSAVTNEGVATSYAFSTSGSTETTTVTDANSQATTVVSDLNVGRITSVTDPLSRVTSFTYDSNGRLTQATRPEGNHVDITYDARGNVTETRAVAKTGTSLPDMVATASYDSTCSNVVTCNQPNSITDTRGNTTDFTYNSTHGGVESVTAPAPGGSGDRPQARYSYTQVTAVTGEPVYMLTGVSACAAGTAGGSPSCVGTTSESRQVIAYDSDNLRTTSVTARNGDNSLSATSAFTYDQIGNTLTVDGPISGSADTTRYRYNDARQVIGVIGPDPDGGGSLHHRALRTTYTNGLPTKVEQGNVNSQSDSDWTSFSPSQRVEQDYDANARPIQQRLMSGSTAYQVSQASYDSLGRVHCTVQRMNPAEFASLNSDACALDTQGTGAGDFGPDRITRLTYDTAGQVTKVETGYGTADAANEMQTTYSNNGQVETVTDANGNKTTYVYDGHDRLSRTRMPDPSTAGTSSTTDYEELTYATASGGTLSTPLVSNLRLRDNTNIAYSYDALNRLTGKNLPGSELDQSFGYDLLGRLVSASVDSSPLTFTYDALGRRLTETSAFGTLTSSWDLAGRRTRLDYGGSLYVDYDHDVAGEVTAIRENGATSGAGVLGTYVYDDLGRRTSLTRGNGAVTSYSYDAVSRLSQLVQNLNGTGSDVTFDYSLNPAGEIASTIRSNDAYAYTAHANANVTSTANGLNQLAITGTTVSHDARGNVDVIGSAGYSYTAENRLAHGPNSSIFAHDPLGRIYFLYGGGESLYLQLDGETPAVERASSDWSIQRRYVPGPGTDEPLVWYEGAGTSTRRWFHADERGSVIAVSDASGDVVTAVNRYDEYGTPEGTLTGRFGYTGQMWLPGAGLYHYRARAYNPAIGRFMQTDPIGMNGGMNLYAYVGNNPVNFTDPLGLRWRHVCIDTYDDKGNPTGTSCGWNDDGVQEGPSTDYLISLIGNDYHYYWGGRWPGDPNPYDPEGHFEPPSGPKSLYDVLNTTTNRAACAAIQTIVPEGGRLRIGADFSFFGLSVGFGISLYHDGSVNSDYYGGIGSGAGASGGVGLSRGTNAPPVGTSSGLQTGGAGGIGRYGGYTNTQDGGEISLGIGGGSSASVSNVTTHVTNVAPGRCPQ